MNSISEAPSQISEFFIRLEFPLLPRGKGRVCLNSNRFLKEIGVPLPGKAGYSQKNQWHHAISRYRLNYGAKGRCCHLPALDLFAIFGGLNS